MLGQFRKQFSKISNFLAKPFIFFKIHPNIVSGIAIPMALISAYFILQNNFAIALVFALLAVLMDFIDGSVARSLKLQSFFGNYFETMVDRIVEFILIVPFVFSFPLASVLALGFSLIGSYAKPRVGLVIITDNRDWPAIGEHAERQLLYLAGIVLSIFSIKLFNFALMELALYSIALIACIGLVQRVFFAKKLVEAAEKEGKILPYLLEKKSK